MRCLSLVCLILSAMACHFDAASAEPRRMECTVAYNSYNTPEKMRRAAEIGMTSVQSYVKWSEIEKAPGEFDWSEYDARLAMAKEAGLKTVFFVIAGPHYATPEFVRQDPAITFHKCLEHGKENLIPSIWCTRFPHYIEQWLETFAEHYRPEFDYIESILLGVTGGYGEAIFTQEMGFFPPTMHHHISMQCGDDLAVADFREHCKEHYGTVAALNADWGTYYPSFADVAPFTRDYAPSPRAWLFEVAWYRGAMTHYCDWWLGTARKAFGEDMELYLCTGGNMTIEHGTDFSAQARVAAKHNAGLRVTNECSHFPKNVFLQRLSQTSCRFYGSFCGNEPASEFSILGNFARFYLAHTGGNRQCFTYFIREGQGEELFVKHRDLLTTIEDPSNEVAVFYPVSAHVMEPSHDWYLDRHFFYRIRECIDHDYLDERLICADALDAYRVLVVWSADIMPGEVIERIAKWVRKGGVLITLNSRAADYHGSTKTFDGLVGLTEASDWINWGSGLQVHRPDVLPSFAKQHCETKNGLTFVADDATVLLGMGKDSPGSLAWMRQAGEGRVFAYHGPGNTDKANGLPHRADYRVSRAGHELARPVSFPVLFLRDVLRNISRPEGALGYEPGSLWLGKNPGVFLSVMENGDILALNVSRKEEHIERFGTRHALPPASIVRIKAPE